jgi:hypothetical protein
LYFTAILPVLRIAASSKIVLSAVNGARATRAKTEIVDRLALDHVSAFSAADSVVNYYTLHHNRKNEIYRNQKRFSPSDCDGIRLSKLFEDFIDAQREVTVLTDCETFCYVISSDRCQPT